MINTICISSEEIHDKQSYEYKQSENHFPISVAKPLNCVAICGAKQVIWHLVPH